MSRVPVRAVRPCLAEDISREVGSLRKKTRETQIAPWSTEEATVESKGQALVGKAIAKCWNSVHFFTVIISIFKTFETEQTVRSAAARGAPRTCAA